MSLQLLDKQISDQVEGKTSITVYFPKLEHPERFNIIEQNDNIYLQYWGNIKKLNAKLKDELLEQFTNEQEYNTDNEVIRTSLNYDDFFDKFWNKLEIV